MTLFRSDCHRTRHAGMNTELRAGRNKAAKRGSGATNRSEMEYDRYPDDHYNRVFDYQRVPASVPADPSPVKRPRPSSPSSSSSPGLKARSSRAPSRSSNTHSSSSSKTKLKMAELLAIKRELTVIKVQIDGLLDCVDKMDRQRQETHHYPECPQPREAGVSDSSHRGSVSSLENSPIRPRESPEPGEASEDEPHYQYYYPHNYHHRIKRYQSDLEDDM